MSLISSNTFGASVPVMMLWPDKAPGETNSVGEEKDMTKPTDGKIAGGKDRFRLTIRNGADDVVYDNVPGASADIDAANPQAIDKGSIVVHK